MAVNKRINFTLPGTDTNLLVISSVRRKGEKVLRVIIFLLSVFVAINVLATAQAPDHLVYQGEKYRLHVNPLEELFLKKEELRPETEIISSANWRGYIATFSINEGSLVVSEITINKSDLNKEHGYLKESVLLDVFPNEADRKMDWFSGLLVVPIGKRTGYVHLSYASQYESYLIIRINNGLVQESTEMDLKEYMDYKVRQFEVYKISPEYESLYSELSKDSEPDDTFDLEGFIFQMGEFTHKIDIPFIPPDKSSNTDAANGASS
jgi:hypothetical protein